MANPTTPPSLISTVFASDTLAALTLTDGLQFDGTQPFSLGAWLLIEPGDAAGNLFSAGDNFVVTLSEFGTIQGNIGTATWIPANRLVPISRWFYLLISVAPVDSDTASVSLYLDGAQADTVTVSATGGGTSTQFTIGGADFQCTALSIWNIALADANDPQQYIQPNWALPAGTHGIVAAVDFTQNPPVDVGPSHYPLSYNEAIPYQSCAVPALYFNGAASAGLASPTGIIPTGQFSVGLWCYISVGAVLGDQITLLQISNADNTQNFTLGFNVPTLGTVELILTACSNGTTQTAPYSFPIEEWTAIGINYDGSTIWLAINDSGWVTSVGFQGFSEPLSSLYLGTTQVYIGSQNFSGYIQYFFTTPEGLSAQQIYTLLTSSLAEQACNCVLQFASQQTFDQISGASVLFYEANISNQTSIWPVAAGTTQAVGQRTSTPPTKRVVPPPTPRWFASANSNNPDILGYNLEIYDQLLSGLPDGARKTRLRQHFQRNLQEGFNRAKTGNWAVPKVQCELIEGKYRFTLSQPFVENDVYELDATMISPCTAWTIAVAAQCVAIAITLFGFAFALRPMVNSMVKSSENLPLLAELPFYEGPGRVGAIYQICGEAQISGTTIVKILQSIYAGGSLTSAIMAGLAGVSWYNWVFTVASLTLSIFGIWCTGGWYLAVILAEFALSVAQLVALIKEKPKNC